MNVNTRIRNRLQVGIALALLGLSGIAPLAGQETLRDMIEEGGGTWLIGDWAGTNDDGVRITVEYEWELDGHAIEVEVTMGEGAYQGLIFRNPESGEVVEVGATGEGGMTKSTWTEEDGKLISKRVGTRANGKVVRIAVISERIDDDSFQATVHRLGDDGEIMEDIIDSVTLKRVEGDEEEGEEESE